MKVAVLADTHAPRYWKACPAEVARRLRGVDLILHAGDVCRATVLEEQAAAVGAAFPRWAAAAALAAEQGRRPVADPEVVAGLLETFGRWVEEALAQVVADARPAS